MSARSLRLWLLAAALLLTQLGGLLHGLGHIAGDKEQPHGACELCVAYAVFDHATAGKPAILPQAASFPAQFGVPQDGRTPLAAPHYRTRAPPFTPV